MSGEGRSILDRITVVRFAKRPSRPAAERGGLSPTD